MTLEGTASGRTRLVQRLPPEELLESAAARIRQLILQSGPIHYGRVLTAIGYLLGPEHRASAAPHVDQLRKMWRQVDPDSREIRAYTVQVTHTTTGETSDPLTADRLAFAWIYGETVHADVTLQAEGQPFGIIERYRAATGIVAELVINTVATLNVVRALHNDGLLAVPNEIFERAVVVDQTEFRQEAEIYVGTSDAAQPPKPGDPPGPDWQPVRGPLDIQTTTSPSAQADHDPR